MQRRIRIFCALILLGHAALSTSYWRQTRAALKPDGQTYRQRRIAHAFQGLPVDEIRERLDQVLPAGAPISLSETLRENGFVKQRLTEALYPHPIEEQSPHQLDIGNEKSGETEDSRVIAVDAAGRRFILRGPPYAPVQHSGQTRPAPSSEFGFSFLALILLLCSALGFGISFFAFTAREEDRAVLWPWNYILAGAMVLAWIVSVSSWLQIPIQWRNLAMAGIILLAARAIQIARTGRKLKAVPAARSRPDWETWIPAVLLIFYAGRIISFPVSLWDGRSIWIFHAKQLFLNGMFTRADLLHPASQWSHPEYPLFMPAWLAFFSSLNTGFNERMSSAAIAVLMASLIFLVWQLSRRELGRLAGAAVTLAAFFGVETLTAGGYVDGLLMLLLLLQFLAFISRDQSQLGWIAAGAASLLKFEGLVFAFAISAACVLLRPEFRSQARRRWPAALFLVPGIIHYVYTKFQGVRGTYPQLHHLSGLGDLVSRLDVIVRDTWEVMKSGAYLQAQSLLWEGFFAAALAVVFWIVFGTWGKTSKLVSALVVIYVAFAYGVMILTPYDLHWHTSSSIDRLLFPPAILAIFGLFDSCRGQNREGAKAAK